MIQQIMITAASRSGGPPRATATNPAAKNRVSARMTSIAISLLAVETQRRRQPTLRSSWSVGSLGGHSSPTSISRCTSSSEPWTRARLPPASSSACWTFASRSNASCPVNGAEPVSRRAETMVVNNDECRISASSSACSAALISRAMRNCATGTVIDILYLLVWPARPSGGQLSKAIELSQGSLRGHQLRELREDGQTTEHENDEEHRNRDDCPQPDQRTIAAFEQLRDDRII